MYYLNYTCYKKNVVLYFFIIKKIVLISYTVTLMNICFHLPVQFFNLRSYMGILQIR